VLYKSTFYYKSVINNVTKIVIISCVCTTYLCQTKWAFFNFFLALFAAGSTQFGIRRLKVWIHIFFTWTARFTESPVSSCKFQQAAVFKTINWLWMNQGLRSKVQCPVTPVLAGKEGLAVASMCCTCMADHRRVNVAKRTEWASECGRWTRDCALVKIPEMFCKLKQNISFQIRVNNVRRLLCYNSCDKALIDLCNWIDTVSSRGHSATCMVIVISNSSQWHRKYLYI